MWSNTELRDIFLNVRDQCFEILDFEMDIPFRVGLTSNAAAIAETAWFENSYGESTLWGIALNQDFVPALDPDELIHVMVHEMAHALLPFDAGHGRAWEDMCYRLGISPSQFVLIRRPQDIANPDVRRLGMAQLVSRVPTLGWNAGHLP